MSRFAVLRKDYGVLPPSATAVPYFSCMKHTKFFKQDLTPCQALFPLHLPLRSSRLTAGTPLTLGQSSSTYPQEKPDLCHGLPTLWPSFYSLLVSRLASPGFHHASPVLRLSALLPWADRLLKATRAQFLYISITCLFQRISRLTWWTTGVRLGWEIRSEESHWVQEAWPHQQCMFAGALKIHPCPCFKEHLDWKDSFFFFFFF